MGANDTRLQGACFGELVSGFGKDRLCATVVAKSPRKGKKHVLCPWKTSFLRGFTKITLVLILYNFASQSVMPNIFSPALISGLR